MRIRPATVQDAGRCAEIYAPFVTDSWISFETTPPDEAEMSRRIEQALASYIWLIAEVEGDVAGYAYGSRHRSRQAYQSSCDVAVYVDAQLIGKGIGSALYESLLPTLKAKKFHAAFAGIALPNEASIGLHQSQGFASIGTYREVGWKMGAWRDVLWMQRIL